MANVTFTSNPQPAPACYPSDVNGMLSLIAAGGISGTVPDNAGGGVYVGSSAPSSALTNKVWFRTDTAGRPLGVYMFYNGNWRKVYTGVSIGTIIMCQFYSGHFDGTGRGLIGKDYDGWAICNGQNSTPNMQSFFPVGGIQGESVGGVAGAWYTDTDGSWKNQGGVKGLEFLTRQKLPKLSAETHAATVNMQGGSTMIYEPAGTGSPLLAYTPVVDGNGTPVDGVNQQALNYPHFQAVGFLMFVGYQ